MLERRRTGCPTLTYNSFFRTYTKFSLPPIAGMRELIDDSSARKSSPTRSDMLRYILAFSFLFLLAGIAFAAAMAASAPTFGQIAFFVCLGLFVAALADGVVERRSHSRK